VRDRDYLLDRHGIVFKVIGDVHPDGHYLGYVKYHPDPRGDRRLYGRTYRQNTVVSKSFGILADRPECYVYSPVLGCVITGLPRQDLAIHYSARQALVDIAADPARVAGARAGDDLRAIITRIMQAGDTELFGVTGSFLVGCHNANSDIDLVCYGPAGYDVAAQLFDEQSLIRRYAGDDLTQLYLRRAKYMSGGSFDVMIKAELRKFQGLAAHSGAHINCEPIRDVGTAGTVCGMADDVKATNIRFAGDELARLRRRADRLGLSIQSYVHDVVMRDVDELETLFAAAFQASVARNADAFAAAERLRGGEHQDHRRREDEAAAELARLDDVEHSGRQAGAA
jgi:predicted nucleotidyltransferase/predicted DNA-binding protein